MLTMEKAIIEHRKMWNWIADEYEKGSTDNVFDIQRRYFKEQHIPNEETPAFSSYCCQYAIHETAEKGVGKMSKNCNYCPIDFKDVDCESENSIYEQLVELSWYKRSKDYLAMSTLARKIANLPEKEEKEYESVDY